MAQAKEKEVGEFNLIITEVDAGRIGDAAGAFAKSFSLDETLSSQILKSAPIIFATKLTKSEVKAITPKLTELSNQGLEFRVTARVAGKVPKVNWPVRPQFTAAGSGGPNGLAFEWDNNAFVCPGCGETFLFRRLGQLKLAEAAAEVAAPVARAAVVARPVPRPAPVAAPVADDMGLEDDIAAPEPFEEGSLEGVEGEPLPGEGESLDLSEPAADVSEAGDGGEVSLDDIPDAPAEDALSDGVAPEPPGDEPSLSDSADEAQAAASPMQQAAEGEEAFNVFLSKITDKTKQDKVAELIGKIKGCSASEAKELCSRLVIPIAKNVGKKQAEDILEQFKRIKIFGRMTKVK